MDTPGRPQKHNCHGGQSPHRHLNTGLPEHEARVLTRVGTVKKLQSAAYFTPWSSELFTINPRTYNNSN